MPNNVSNELLEEALNKIAILRKDIINLCPPAWISDVFTVDKNKHIKHFEKILKEVDNLNDIIVSIKN